MRVDGIWNVTWLEGTERPTHRHEDRAKQQRGAGSLAVEDRCGEMAVARA